MKKKFDIKSFLEQYVKPAAGCTEIVAIGISSCAAYNALFHSLPGSRGIVDVPYPDMDKVELLEVVLDKRLYKNAFCVNIPNTYGNNGIDLAASIGIFLNINETDVLEIFMQIKPQMIEDAKKILDRATFNIDRGRDALYVKTTLKYDGHTIICTILDSHDNISSIFVDGIQVFDGSGDDVDNDLNLRISDFSIDELIDIVSSLPENIQDELKKTVDLNMSLVVEGMCHFSTQGGIVHILKELISEGLLSDDLSTKIKISVAAAVEARMGGVPLSAMSSSGSGNMGITATVPIIIVGQELDVHEDEVLRALLLSHLVVRMASDNIGDLSALCGASNKSSFGAAAGIAYLLGAGPEGIKNSINMVASNLIGATCDGAKSNCALKAMSSASVAYESALLGTWGLMLGAQGIVGDTALQTLKNVSELSHRMDKIDDVIVDILKRR